MLGLFLNFPTNNLGKPDKRINQFKRFIAELCPASRISPMLPSSHDAEIPAAGPNHQFSVFFLMHQELISVRTYSTNNEVRAAQVRAVQVRAAQVRAVQVRAAQVRAVQVRAAQLTIFDPYF